MAVQNPARAARLGASIEKAFGETFNIEPMVAQADINDRFQLDSSRGALSGITGVWDGPAKSKTPTARGSVQDDNAHNWVASFPSANFADDVVAGIRKGDKLTRILDGTVYMVDRVMPNGFGRTTLQLTARKR